MKDYKYWTINKINTTNDNPKKPISIEITDKDRMMSAYFKWDGCIDLNKYYNGYTVDDKYSEGLEENSDYIHICQINDMIARLQELKQIAEDMLDKNDYNTYWK